MARRAGDQSTSSQTLRIIHSPLTASCARNTASTSLSAAQYASRFAKAAPVPMAQRVQTSTSMPLRTIDKGDSSLLSASTGCVVYMRHVQECKQWKVQGTCGNAEDCLYAHPALGSRKVSATGTN
ncbi:hypothetical protein BCR37DRAFT_406124 [Protomyces lactucae-debilis]|uniref:C3H1-type domain-containing protein n=1 Tax=Protomyces lactucae-debilis TaxID=2754530 RepID=A0A1Y2EYK9_PROLT|nr:uncharacterized protein BCR37DRAFT_406124 [Protomyces lactucae-debilis]ORY76678.1 hypothetical protein BCR37DRAFT_406124 [Protomyces lactucae-debilis]